MRSLQSKSIQLNKYLLSPCSVLLTVPGAGDKGANKTGLLAVLELTITGRMQGGWENPCYQ